MTTYTATGAFFDSWQKRIAEEVNISSDTFKMLLLNSGYTPNVDTQDELADIVASEISGSGYARQTLGSVTWNEAAGTSVFDFSDVVFSASGGSIVARYWAIYDDTVAGDPLVAYGLLSDSGSDVTTSSGNDLTFHVNAAGFFQLSKV